MVPAGRHRTRDAVIGEADGTRGAAGFPRLHLEPQWLREGHRPARRDDGIALCRIEAGRGVVDRGAGRRRRNRHRLRRRVPSARRRQRRNVHGAEIKRIRRGPHAACRPVGLERLGFDRRRRADDDRRAIDHRAQGGIRAVERVPDRGATGGGRERDRLRRGVRAPGRCHRRRRDGAQVKGIAGHRRVARRPAGLPALHAQRRRGRDRDGSARRDDQIARRRLEAGRGVVERRARRDVGDRDRPRRRVCAGPRTDGWGSHVHRVITRHRGAHRPASLPAFDLERQGLRDGHGPARRDDRIGLGRVRAVRRVVQRRPGSRRRHRDVLVDVIRACAWRQGVHDDFQRVGIAVDVAGRNARLPRLRLEREALRHTHRAARRHGGIGFRGIDARGGVVNGRARGGGGHHDVEDTRVHAREIAERRSPDLPRVRGRADLHGQEAADLRAVADLRIGVLAPGPHRAVGGNGGAVQLPARDLRDIRQSGHRHRRGPPRRRAIAQFAVIVVAPGPQREILSDRQRVIGASGNRGDKREVHSRHRRALLGGGRVTELAVGIQSPRLHAAVALERERVIGAGGDRRDSSEPAHLHRRGALRGRSVAQLVVAVIPPSPQGAVALHRQRVVPAGGDRDDARQARHLHR